LIFLAPEIAAALWVHIYFFETTLSNLIHEVLSKEYSSQDWFGTSGILSKHEMRQVNLVVKLLENKSQTVINLRSRLSMSFWIELCSTRYHQKVWILLEKANPLLFEKRREFYRKAREIRNLRNSIAHHGPIMRRNLIRDHEYLHELTATLDPDLADAVQKRSRVLDLLLNARLVGSGGGI
jgi:hypothetical protein